ncbi:hypothetical protein LP420_33045 [Massilia sp. B-10]|nr:hypothetical protein LP420_33045 [Massilia sp. B-10]
MQPRPWFAQRLPADGAQQHQIGQRDRADQQGMEGRRDRIEQAVLEDAGRHLGQQGDEGQYHASKKYEGEAGSFEPGGAGKPGVFLHDDSWFL